MERIGIFGLSWRQGGAETLARFTIPVDQRPSRIPELSRKIGVAELVYLATCNRVELMLVADGVTPMDEYRDRVYQAFTARRTRSSRTPSILRCCLSVPSSVCS